MRIINASYKILTPINDKEILKHIELATRQCYQSFEHINENSAEKLVKNIIDKGHLTPLEHVSITVEIICDRAISHELVRHRLASYSQESSRYCSYSKDKFNNELTFIDPSLAFNWDLNNEEDIKKYRIWHNAMAKAEQQYMELLKLSTPDEARSILPNSTKTTITMTANLREWRHIFELRSVGKQGKPHPQMIEIMLPMLNEFKSKIPVIFYDIG